MMNLAKNKSLLVGNKVSLKKVIVAVIIIIFVSALLTGFGYQPFWLFLIVMLIGLIFTLPAFFSSYWMIQADKMTIVSFSNNNLLKWAQLLKLKDKQITEVHYSSIKSAQIEYRKKQRFGPFDINNDCLQINFKLKDGQSFSLPIEPDLTTNLGAFSNLLITAGVDVEDRQNVIKILKNGQNLFEHFNS